MKRTLITGASSGIGLELCRLFARDGYSLILVARSVERLNEIATELKALGSPEAIVIGKDLSCPEAPQELYNEVTGRGLSVDVLVNNAGFGSSGKLWEIGLSTEVNELQVNITSLTILTKLFVRDMVKLGRGRVLNVASTASFQPGPFMAVYYASKAYVLHFTEALASELKGTGVEASCLCPGPTETYFHISAGMQHSRLFSTQVMSAEKAARIAYGQFGKNKRIIIPGLKNKLLSQSYRFFPRAVIVWAVKFINGKIK